MQQRTPTAAGWLVHTGLGVALVLAGVLGQDGCSEPERKGSPPKGPVGRLVLSVAPSAVKMKATDRAKVTVTVLNRMLYNGSIELEFLDLPANVTAARTAIPAKQDSVEVELTTDNAHPDVRGVRVAPRASGQQPGGEPKVFFLVVEGKMADPRR